MEEKKISEKESLEIITEMISRTKERYIGDGNIMLMWGYLTVSVAALVWIMLVMTHNPAWNWLWFAIGIVGGILTPVLDRKQRHRTGVKKLLGQFHIANMDNGRRQLYNRNSVVPRIPAHRRRGQLDDNAHVGGCDSAVRGNHTRNNASGKVATGRRLGWSCSGYHYHKLHSRQGFA